MDWRDCNGEDKAEMMFKQVLNIFGARKTPKWSLIEGKDDLKEIFDCALLTSDHVNIMLRGPRATAKSLFLQEIEAFYPKEEVVFLDGGNLTNRLLDIMQDGKDKIRIILIDEFEKLARNYAQELLLFLWERRVKVEKQKKQYDFYMKNTKVFVACNATSKFSEELLSRFDIYDLPEYDFVEFQRISSKILGREKRHLAPEIAKAVWFDMKSRDVRDIVKMSWLILPSDNPEDVARKIATKLKYRGAPK